MVSKFNDGIKSSIRWKPESVAAEIKHLKDTSILVFSTTELSKSNQICSYFLRLKSTKKIQLKECSEDDVEAFEEEQAINEMVQQ